MDSLLLTVPQGIAPRTSDGSWGIVMFHASGRDDRNQWFNYRPSPYEPLVQAKWPLGTMMATIPAKIADVLVQSGYARVMTLEEARSYNKSVERTREETTGFKLNLT